MGATCHIMSIQISHLLELSHDLCYGRKRRSEWERIERNSRQRTMLALQPTAEEGTTDTVPACDNAAEMKYLHAVLGEQGLVPRDAFAEHAMLQLLSAESLSKQQLLLPGAQGSDLEWISAASADVTPVRSRRSSIVSSDSIKACKPTGGDDLSADEIFHRLISVDAGSGDETEVVAPIFYEPPSSSLNANLPSNKHAEDDADDFVAFEDASIVAVRRLPEALDRLRALCRVYAPCEELEESEDYDDYDHEHDEEMQKMIEDMSREAMADAERHELSSLLMSTALEVAVETHCTVTV